MNSLWLSVLAIVTIGLLMAPITVNAAPSYDCGRASTPDEIAICANPKLAQLDVQVAQTYSELREIIGGEAIRSLARPLLDMRRSCGGHITCIENAQRFAISSYRNALSGLRQKVIEENSTGGPNITALIRAWNNANNGCRGGVGQATVERNCEERVQFSAQLKQMGLCSGRYNLPFEDWDASILVRERWIPCIYSNLVD